MKKAIIAIFIIAVVSFTIGLYVGDNYGNGRILGPKINPQEKGDYKDTFSDGWQAAKDKIKEAGGMVMPITETRILSGDIEKIDGNKITFKTFLLNPLADDDLKTRVAIIDNETSIIVYGKKSEEEANEDREESRKKLGGLRIQRETLSSEVQECLPAPAFILTEEPEATTSPDPCTETRKELDELNNLIMELEMDGMSDFKKIEDASLSDIKEGYSITVEAEEDISEKGEFKAIKIEAREFEPPLEMPTEMPTTEAGDTMPTE